MTSRGLSLAWVRPARAGPSISPRELPRDHRGFATSDHASCLSFLSFLYAPRVRPAHTAQAQLVQDRKRLPRNRHSQSTRLPFLSEHLERACARSYPPPPTNTVSFADKPGIAGQNLKNWPDCCVCGLGGRFSFVIVLRWELLAQQTSKYGSREGSRA